MHRGLVPAEGEIHVCILATGLHAYMPGDAGSDAASVSAPSFYDTGCYSEDENHPWFIHASEGWVFLLC